MKNIWMGGLDHHQQHPHKKSTLWVKSKLCVHLKFGFWTNLFRFLAYKSQQLGFRLEAPTSLDRILGVN